VAGLIPSLAAIMNEQKNLPLDDSRDKRQEEYRQILYYMAAGSGARLR
jgi:hypothetical protein